MIRKCRISFKHHRQKVYGLSMTASSGWQGWLFIDEVDLRKGERNACCAMTRSIVPFWEWAQFHLHLDFCDWYFVVSWLRPYTFVITTVCGYAHMQHCSLPQRPFLSGNYKGSPWPAINYVRCLDVCTNVHQHIAQYDRPVLRAFCMKWPSHSRSRHTNSYRWIVLQSYRNVIIVFMIQDSNYHSS